jgi:hypothetical protein
MASEASERINMSDHRPSGKSNSAYTMCNKEVLYHGFLCFVAIVVIVTQATVLNFYIIAYYREFYHHVSHPVMIAVNHPTCLIRAIFFILRLQPIFFSWVTYSLSAFLPFHLQQLTDTFI